MDFDLASDFETFFSTSGLKVWANYFYLDTEERRRFAQKGHEYLITQTQHTGVDTVTNNGSKNVRLSLNHPVKELVWCFNGGSAKSSLWNFTGDQADTGSVILESNPDATTDIAAMISPADVGCPMVSYGTGGSSKSLQERGATSATASAGPLSEFKLILNGQDRMKAQSGEYFNSVQAHQHHSGSPMPGVYSYSFALKPEEHQPTGTCNFSRIDNAQVAVTLKDTSAVPRPPLCLFSRLTTTSSGCNPEWGALASARKRDENRAKKQALKAFVLLVCSVQARQPGCGKFLRAQTTTLLWKHLRGSRLMAEPDGKKV